MAKRTKKSSKTKTAKPKSKAKAPKAKTVSNGCICGGECHDPHANLPGYILIALGVIAIPLNFGMVNGLDFTRAWPLLFVLFGFVLLAKVQFCRKKSR